MSEKTTGSRPKPRKNPPKHLSPTSRKWWAEVSAAFELERHHELLLTGACECLDRIEEARAQIAKDGAYVTDRYHQVKPHPAHRIEAENRTLFARLLRELQLDKPVDESRPPMLSGYYRPANMETR